MDFLSRSEIRRLPKGVRVRMWRAGNHESPRWTSEAYYDVLEVKSGFLTLQSHADYSRPVVFAVDNIDGTTRYGLTY